jgi:hypothetical protein
MASWTSIKNYAGFNVGEEVIASKHIQIDPTDPSSDHWSQDMDQYVGLRAKITGFTGFDPWNQVCALLDIDSGRHEWRVSNLKKSSGPGPVVPASISGPVPFSFLDTEAKAKSAADRLGQIHVDPIHKLDMSKSPMECDMFEIYLREQKKKNREWEEIERAGKKYNDEVSQQPRPYYVP